MPTATAEPIAQPVSSASRFSTAPAGLFKGDRSGWRRPQGNAYASDSTYEVATVLASNRRCWDLIEEYGLRSEDGTVDAQSTSGGQLPGLAFAALSAAIIALF